MNRSRVLSFLVAVAMCAGILSVAASGAETTNYDGYTFDVWSTSYAEKRGAVFSGSGTTAWWLDIRGASVGSTFTMEAAGNDQYYIYGKFHGKTYYLEAVKGDSTTSVEYYLGPTSSSASAARWTLEKGKFYTTVNGKQYLLYMYWNQSPYSGHDAFRLTSDLNYNDPMNYYYMGLTPPHDHSFTTKQSKSMASAATCTEAATYYVQCDICDEITKEKVVSAGEAKGHDYQDHDPQAATCENIGWESYQTCSRCDYSTYQELPVLGHNFDSDIVKFQWSDDNSCVVSIYCANLCGAAEDHACEVATVQTDGSDCQTKGSIVYTARYDDYSNVKTVEGAVGSHSPGAEATCTEDQVCTICSEILEEAKGHTFDCTASETAASEATCTEAATYFVRCDNCDEITRDKTVSVGEANGHSYGEPFFNWAADFSSASAVMICSGCGQGVQGSSSEVLWSSEDGKLSAVAKVTLNGTVYTDIKVVTAKVSDGKVIVSLPKEMPGVTIYAAGYGTNQAMTVCDFANADETLVELDVTGETIKLFFLDSETFTPIMPSLIAK